jgi:hypothetical protein
MSCPGGSVLNCRSCGHIGYCGRAVVCHGQCGFCDDCECDNHPGRSSDVPEDDASGDVSEDFGDSWRNRTGDMRGENGRCLCCGRILFSPICEDCLIRDTYDIHNEYLPMAVSCPECGSQFIDDSNERDNIDLFHRCTSCSRRAALESASFAERYAMEHGFISSRDEYYYECFSDRGYGY